MADYESDNVFENKITLPGSEVSRSMIGSSTQEDGIIWKEGGLRDRLVDLESQVASLQGVLGQMVQETRRDPVAAPEVDATTSYELASDGTLRAAVDVTIEGEGLVEVAMLEAPTVEYASKDATVDEGNPTTNYNTKLECGLDASGNALYPLLACSWGTWGASPTGLWAANPVLALVRLMKDGTSDDATNIEIFPVDRDASTWAEGTVTWDTMPAAESAALDQRVNDTAADYCYFDITAYIKRAREMKDGGWTGVPEGFYLEGAGPELDDGDSVTFYTKGEATADRKPQVWYWESVYKSQVLGGSTRQAKFYGNAGGSYYLVYRLIDRNNNPGRWSTPVEITLPSQGATPSTPSDPTVSGTIHNQLKIIALTTSVPTDFAYFYLKVQNVTAGTTTYFKTRSDRFLYHFVPSGTSSNQTIRVYVQIVTRSGVASEWSGYAETTIYYYPSYNCNHSHAYGAHALEFADGYTRIRVPTNNDTAGLVAYFDTVEYKMLVAKVKEITQDLILSSCGQASNDSSQSTTSTTYVDRTTGSITLTPPGSGDAYYLLIGKFTLFKDGANEIKVTFKVDGTETNSEEGYSASGEAETVTIARRVAVTAGSSHTFKLCFKSGDGGSATVYRTNIMALHLGNY